MSPGGEIDVSVPRGLWAASVADPDRVVLIDSDDQEWTAGELVSAANQLVHALRARGVTTGSSVALISPNRAETFVVLLAVFQAGWRFTPINTHLTPTEMAYVLRDSDARVVVGHEALAETVAAAAEEADVRDQVRLSIGEIPGFERLDEAIAGQPASSPPDRLAGQFMQYTSGTTGHPKAVVRELPDIDPEGWVQAYSPNLTRYRIEPGGDHVHLVTSPMYHMAPLSFGWFSSHLDHTVVLMDHWDATEALRLIERHRVTTTHMVPTQFHRLLRLPEEVRDRYDTSSLSNVIHAAAPCPVPLKRRMFEWWGPVIYEYYGATEGGGTLALPEEWLTHEGTVGYPWPGADIRILDDDGKQLGAGEIGLVYMKMMGDWEYKGDPAKTEAGRADGYFTVGDMGELDDDGFLYLRDRKIDMIIAGGVNVYPAEVEAVLLDHPAVIDVAVFGVPHPDWGEEVKAAVELDSSTPWSDDLEADITAHCAAILAGYKCPRSYDIVASMPRDPNGKLYKRRLRDPYWKGHDRVI